MEPRYRAPSIPHVLCTVDPGKRACGVALWSVSDGKGILSWSGLVAQRDGNATKLARQIVGLPLPVEGVRIYYIEDPQFYRSKRKAHADLASLKKLIHSLEYEGARPLLKIKPVAWKGNVPKEVHHERLKKELSRSELKLVPEDHNVWDAVGLGLYALGRTQRGGACAGRIAS